MQSICCKPTARSRGAGGLICNQNTTVNVLIGPVVSPKPAVIPADGFAQRRCHGWTAQYPALAVNNNGSYVGLVFFHKPEGLPSLSRCHELHVWG